jgi:hypothetical protein
MSCFIVGDDTIDRIISTIELQGGWARHANPISVLFTFDWNALGRAMLALNLDAFRDRYEDRHQEDVRDDLDAYRWQGRYVPLVEGYKSLRCFLYQCNEGQVCERPLYRALEAYADHLAVKITEETPAYRSAAWA